MRLRVFRMEMHLNLFKSVADQISHTPIFQAGFITPKQFGVLS